MKSDDRTLGLFDTPPQAPKKLDATASELAREDGIRRVTTGSPAGWQESAVAVIKSVAQRFSHLCSDDLWASGLTTPPESRALGAAMRVANTLGYIRSTDEFVLTHQKSRHRAPIRVWKSLLAAEAPFEERNLLSRRPSVTP